MSKNDIEKTNAMRMLDQKKIPYKSYTYEGDGTQTGVEIAQIVGQIPNQVFKTLVTVGASKKNYVFVIPVTAELDLKKAARAVGEKNVEMLKSKDLLPTTGYIHGGCSPIGMKKPFKTTFDISAQTLDTVIFSGGKIGFQIEITLENLKRIISFSLCDVVVE